ncbi:hypothetical protein, partial [Marivirga sp.]|uniref:hypothetical protein n=1 Tax=Marivirga sp. TaxID=2018662 RepID=UPI003DA77CDB
MGRRTNLSAGRQECEPACADKPDEDVSCPLASHSRQFSGLSDCLPVIYNKGVNPPWDLSSYCSYLYLYLFVKK